MYEAYSSKFQENLKYYMIYIHIGFVGNTLVIIVILQHERMRTVTNFFLANLALSDLCVGLFCVLPSLLVNLTIEWYLGKVSYLNGDQITKSFKMDYVFIYK